MAQRVFQYTHVENGLVESVTLRQTGSDAYPSGWKYALHLGTLDDLTLIRYDNAHEDTKGHERHLATGDVQDVDFSGMAERLAEFWSHADHYWDAVDGRPPRPYDP